ncbi:metallophosphoesterase MPPED2 [Procambarus clarkii]|uniref:metallophosphoesterase MPPED2 n=1 Tax=Procambarus clarkii TaxID=6728 RepID=UPI001E672ACD|nr:metallophosphoesterase MPPED2-like [Procambarus clarkii]
MSQDIDGEHSKPRHGCGIMGVCFWPWSKPEEPEEERTANPVPAAACHTRHKSQIVKTLPVVTPLTPAPHNMVRFVCMSDTHNGTKKLPHPVPDGDVLLHAGDFTQRGTIAEARQFNDWLGTLPHPHKVVISGNHEVLLDQVACYTHKAADPLTVLRNATYLQDSSVTIYGIKIYGAPWTPEYHVMAFNLPRGKSLQHKWQIIPTDTDILMTHEPPLGHGDLTWREQRVGCVDLLAAVQTRIKPAYHVFGHIHEGYGMTTDGTTVFVNASTCDVTYEPVNPPVVFDMPLPEGYTKLRRDSVSSAT